MIREKLIHDLKEMLTSSPDENRSGTGFYLLSTDEVKGIVGVLEQVDELEKQSHTEKDILFNLIQSNFQKRVDYLLESLENISTEICMNRHDSTEKALSVIRKANQRDLQFREELKKNLMS